MTELNEALPKGRVTEGNKKKKIKIQFKHNLCSKVKKKFNKIIQANSCMREAKGLPSDCPSFRGNYIYM